MATDFTLILRPTPGTDAVQAVRQLLKVAGRRFGLRCVQVQAGGDVVRLVPDLSIQRHHGKVVAVLADVGELVSGARLKAWTPEYGAVDMAEAEPGTYWAPDTTAGLVEVFGITADGRGVHAWHAGDAPLDGEPEPAWAPQGEGTT